ncbi:MAG: hypothetical protein EZS28_001715 [Streblomastix strix]|uniref:Uncharacterized protein n=1 Tax=Streblomastix strix TaxID=222440 RepID=A0A5J4X673_9EUKA|nr:MAG: hypothetical protein EZS28_001715 [Streblomastix strix]
MNSGILEKVKSIIRDIVDAQRQTSKNAPFQGTLEQLWRIFLYITGEAEVDQQVLEIASKILVKSLSALYKTIIKYGAYTDDNQKEGKIFQRDKFETILKTGEKTLNVFYSLGMTPQKKEYFASKVKIHEKLAPLFHINCSPKLHCPYRIELYETPVALHFQSVVNLTHKALFAESINIQKYMIQEHAVVDHIAYLAQEFAGQYADKKEITTFSQTAYRVPVITSAFVILTFFDPSLQKFISQFPGLIPSVVQLTRYNRKLRIGQNIELEYKLRTQSLQVLHRFWNYNDDPLIHQLIIECHYIDVVIEALSTAGGIGEEGHVANLLSFSNINNSFIILRMYKDPKTRTQLIKTLEEQIRESGGAEELEAQIFKNDENNSWVMAYNAKQEMINRFKYDLNYIQ